MSLVDDAPRSIELSIDVTQAAGLGEPATQSVSVVLPRIADLPPNPVVCFALPGATYNRKYFMLDLPALPTGGQAGWHAQRGWIFVAIDHLGVGDSSLHEPARLVLENVAAANHAVVTAVLDRLARGDLAPGFPRIAKPVALGLGQSMGGCLTVIQQARHESFDGIAILGFSAVHTHSPALPGSPRITLPYIPRDTYPGGPDGISLQTPSAAVNSTVLALGREAAMARGATHSMPTSWHYHFDDEPRDLVEQDMQWRDGPPPWRSATMPGLILWVTAPGAIAPEAASIVVPVLAAFGERDVLEDPRLEAKAYRAAVDFSLFICPRMAHMHNFANTREILWTRISSWGRHVAELKQLLGDLPAKLYSDSYPR